MTERVRVAETERLTLTRPHADDGPAVFAVHGDPATNLHNPDGPHRSLDESEACLEGWLDDWVRDGVGYCAVALRGQPEAVIGFAGVRVSRLEGEDVLNLYYRFVPSAWGRGFAGEAARAALDFACPLFPDTAVVALIREDNTSSGRLAERLGLQAGGDRDAAGRLIYRLPATARLTRL
ncbi:GNAT family N-acetyltransferase [Streptomyces sp. SCUT-3]|uniref:GNAT family N-acetyltransferase n=1 Tax=Streptomyces sp. SCUT-3 TaxID=2684469 RepID=UPI0015FDD821|nr:GNAT family N-acetyltransferase [Streptomyces sp. SCUT-3]